MLEWCHRREGTHLRRGGHLLGVLPAWTGVAKAFAAVAAVLVVLSCVAVAAVAGVAVVVVVDDDDGCIGPGHTR